MKYERSEKPAECKELYLGKLSEAEYQNLLACHHENLEGNFLFKKMKIRWNKDKL